MAYIIEIIIKLIPFLRVTLLLAVTAMVLGIAFGGLLAAMKLGKNPLLRKIAEVYTTLIRCTPMLILIFLSYYGLPLLVALAGIDISDGSKIGFSIVALTMYASATLSEIIRPAYIAVDKRQLEAAQTSGLSTLQGMFHIIVPQMFFIALPNMGNMLIALIQESALAYLIGVVDIMGQAKVINSMSYGVHIIQIYLAVSVLYWLLSLAVGKSVDIASYRMTKILKG